MKKKIVPWILVFVLLSACAKAPQNGEDLVNQETPFSALEVQEIQKLTQETLFEKFGEPLNETQNNGKHKIEFADANVLFVHDSLANLRVQSNTIIAPREVKIGDTLEKVLIQFPDEGDETLYDSDTGGQYRILYGEFVHMSAYGVLQSTEDGQQFLTVSEDGCTVNFYFDKDNLLQEIDYNFAD